MIRKTKGTADSVDKHVGKRIRERRMLMGLSQDKLASSVGVTFQQVQKYERGANRVSASRLYTFSKVLGVPLNFFFSGIEKEHASLPHSDIPVDLTYDKETLTLVRTYYNVKDKPTRAKLMRCIAFIADQKQPEVKNV